VSRFVSRSHIQRQEVEMAEITARRWLCRGLATIGATLLATTASAQASDTAVRMPAWDASGSLAIHFFQASDLDGSADDYYDSEALGQPGAHVGRYVTPHLKVELGVRGPMQYTSYDTILVPAPLPGGFAETWVDRNVRVVSFAPAITWQFFENTFTHPYVSAGVAVDLVDIHRFREAGTESYPLSRTTVRYDVPGIDTRKTVVKARPFFAAGSKSYFGNGRWFVRPEVEIGVAKSRIGAVSLRLGVGVDF
jgi:hypothetical protein